MEPIDLTSSPARHSSAIRVKPQTAAALYTPVASTSIDSKGKGQTSITASIAASVSSEANEDHADARAAPLPALSDYRANLNDMQLRAVTHDLVPLQILAGPGSGKTRVLTCRVAHLLRHYRLPPDRIVVVTFTNKAAREMRDRLTRLVGKAVTDKLVMGTFHSVAVRFLRRFGQRIGLAKDFSIADEDDCMRYIRASLKLHTKDVDRHSMSANLKPGTVRSLISKAKTRCLDAERYEAEVRAKKPLQEDLLLVARVFADYETKLQEVGALDFDDLLNFCLHLFLRYPAVTEGIRHTLVDEFQDTNTVQYQLVKHMARKARVLTIVGDPDQSIYGWRAAEIKNLRLMQGDFESTAKIFLEQNYRSTSAILASAMAVISQDTAREPKHLYTDRDAGPSNVYTRLPDANAEAEYIVKEIRKLVAWTGGLLDYDDFAILLRMNSLSRQLEMELKAQRVPYRMVGGPKFFDRQEVKDILAYLLLANNANNASAFSRVINTPSRGIGLKSAQWIEEHASARKISPFELTRLAVTKSVKLGKVNEGNPIKGEKLKAFQSFVELIQDLELLAAEGTSVADLIDAIVDKTRYLDYLEKQHGQKDAKAGVKSEDVENRKANIEELKAFAATFKAPEGDQGLTGVHEEVGEVADSMETGSSALADFIAGCMLATDTDKNDQEGKKPVPMVTVSTVHAAKGLEWPCVFIAAVEDGKFPSFFSKTEAEVDEERRLLYVAMTRAQGFLYLTWTHERWAGGESRETAECPFLRVLPADQKLQLFRQYQEAPKPDDVALVASLISRPVPAADKLAEGLIAFPPAPRVTISQGPAGGGYRGKSSYDHSGGFSAGTFRANYASSRDLIDFDGKREDLHTSAQSAIATNCPPRTKQEVPEGAANGFRSARAFMQDTKPSLTDPFGIKTTAAQIMQNANRAPMKMQETRMSQLGEPLLFGGQAAKPANLSAFEQSSKAALIAFKNLPATGDFIEAPQRPGPAGKRISQAGSALPIKKKARK